MKVKFGFFDLASSSLLENFFSTIFHAIDKLACLGIHSGHQPSAFICMYKDQTQEQQIAKSTATKFTRAALYTDLFCKCKWKPLIFFYTKYKMHRTYFKSDIIYAELLRSTRSRLSKIKTCETLKFLQRNSVHMTNEALTTAIEEKPLTTHPLGERITLAIILTLMALIVCAALAFGFDAVVATQTDVLFILLDGEIGAD